MTQIAAASDGKLKIGSCHREDVAGVTDADSSEGIHFTGSSERREGRIQSPLTRVSDSSPKQRAT